MTSQEQETVRRIRHGDKAAFETLFKEYHAPLCAFALDYVNSSTKAHDIVQNVFLKLWQMRKEWEVRRSLQAYLYQAVRNRSLNTIRNEKTRREAHSGFAAIRSSSINRTAEDQLYFGQLSDAIDEVIEKLPKRRREAFVLHRRHNLTYVEVAEIMDISPKTVENQIGRALKFMRKHLANHFLPDRLKQ